MVGELKMVQSTKHRGTAVAVYAANTPATKLLDANPNRLYYSVQNLDAANYIALGTNPLVTAGVYGINEGQHLAAGQPMSDDTDKGPVYACANGAIVNVSIYEVSTIPASNLNRRKSAYRPKERDVFRPNPRNV